MCLFGGYPEPALGCWGMCSWQFCICAGFVPNGLYSTNAYVSGYVWVWSAHAVPTGVPELCACGCERASWVCARVCMCVCMSWALRLCFSLHMEVHCERPDFAGFAKARCHSFLSWPRWQPPRHTFHSCPTLKDYSFSSASTARAGILCNKVSCASQRLPLPSTHQLPLQQHQPRLNLG